MKKNYILNLFAALVILPTVAVSAQGEFPERRLTSTAPAQLSEVMEAPAPNEDKNKGKLIYATTLLDYSNERGWYEIRANVPYEYKKIKTWDPGSGSKLDGLHCGSWGGDAYYAFRVFLYDLNLDYPDSFVKVDVKTGEWTVVRQFSKSDDFVKNWKSKYNIYDMTYDIKKDVIYAYGQTKKTDRSVTSIYKVDKTNGDLTLIKDLDFISFVMAVDFEGNMWVQTGIYDGDLLVGCKLICMDTDNFNTIKEIELKNDGAPFKMTYYGTMSFDYSTDDLYLLACNGASSDMEGLYLIDEETGEMINKGPVWGNFVGMYIPYLLPEKENAPAMVSDLNAVSDAEGALKATLTWTNPSKQWNQEELTDLSEIRIYRKGNDVPVEKVAVTSDKIGQQMSWVDESPVNGMNSYFIAPYSVAGGEGLRDSIEVFVGQDVPGAVKNLVIEGSAESVILSWEAPERGLNGGSVNASDIKYTIVRYPDNKVVAENISETTFTDAELIGQLCYRYEIKTSNEIGEGATQTSDDVIAGAPHEVSFGLNFVDELYSKAWTNLGRWSWTPGSMPGDERMYTTAEQMENNWLVSPDFKLEAGKKYRLTTTIKTDIAPNNGLYNFKFALGKGKTVDAMGEKTIRDVVNFRCDEYYKETVYEDIIDVTETGVYNFGIESSYNKNGDMFSLKSIYVEPAYNADMVAVGIKNLAEVVYNKDNNCIVEVRNKGLVAATEYTVKIVRVDDEGNYVVLGETTDVPVLAPGKSKEVDFTFKPDLEQDMEIFALVEIKNDGNEENNISEAYPIIVLPEDMAPYNRYIMDESVADHDTRVPLSFVTAETMTQTIYLADEINVTMNSRIQRIAYEYEGNEITSTLGPVNVKIYMSNTDKEYFASDKDMIPLNSMKVVWEGEVSINPGSNIMTFFLNEEFVYAHGKNLCIALTKSGNVGNIYPAVFKVFNGSYDTPRTYLQEGAVFTTRSIPALNIALIEDLEAVGLEKEITVAPKVWYNREASTLNFEGKQLSEVSIFDISGKMIETFDNVEYTESVNVSLPTGIYVVNTVDVDGNVENIKVSVVK